MVMSQYSLDTTLKTYCDQERHIKDFSVAENKFRASLSPGANVSSQTVTRKPSAKALITNPRGSEVTHSGGKKKSM